MGQFLIMIMLPEGLLSPLFGNTVPIIHQLVGKERPVHREERRTESESDDTNEDWHRMPENVWDPKRETGPQC